MRHILDTRYWILETRKPEKDVKGVFDMASSTLKNKIIQAMYRPRKSKSSSIMLKDLEAMEKALESVANGFTGKKEKKEK